jgi:SdpC family antimicrobial peptide
MPGRSRWLLPLVVAALAAGCDEAPIAPGDARLSTAAYADAETMFKGLVFGNGYVADAIPEIRDNFKVEVLEAQGLNKAELLDVQSRILYQIKLKDPGFLNRFKSAMNSGDHYRIGSMLDTAGVVVNDAVNHTAEGDEIAMYEADYNLLQNKLQPHLDANGYLSLGDTAVTVSETSAELSTTTGSEYSKPSGPVTPFCHMEPCDNPQGIFRIYKHGLAVYYVAAVHVAVIYNAAVAITGGVKVAVFARRMHWTANTSVLRDQMINSIAYGLRA